MATVVFDKVSKAYGHQTILEDIDLRIEKGEFIVVIGPSGCGKSTLLRLVTGLETISLGKILINDQCINSIPPGKRDMAMVFQQYALYPHMTVYDNMAYALKMRGMKSYQIKNKITNVAELLDLLPHLNRKPESLSGGQKQRVAMGLALARSPSVFLFDEPLSNLDTQLKTSMRYEIKKFHETLQTTCLYVTHDQMEAMTLASRIVVLNKGRIEQIATPQKLYQKPASLFVAEFSSYCPINLIPAKIDLSQQKLITDLGFDLPLPTLNESVCCGAPVIVGIRPEHLRLTSQDKANAVKVHLDFVDDFGSDKIIHVHTLSRTQRCQIKIPADDGLPSGPLCLDPLITKANLFDEKTGLRLGGWDGESRQDASAD